MYQNYELVNSESKDDFAKLTNEIYASCLKDCKEFPKKKSGKIQFSKTDILSVPKEEVAFLLAKSMQAGGNVTYFVDANHPEISRVKQRYLTNLPAAAGGETGDLISFTLKTGEKKYFYISDSLATADPNNLCKKINRLKMSAPGKDRELTLPKKRRKTTTVQQSRFWGGDWEENEFNQAHYRLQSDPMLLQNLSAYVFSKASKDKTLTIMDIGGGKGRLAAKIILAAKKADIKLRYILLEPDESQAQKARETFSKLDKICKEKLLTEVIVLSLEKFAKQDNYKTYEGMVDCIVSSGGPLNHTIVTEAAAKANLKIMHSLLATGGKIIANGLSLTLVGSKDFYNCRFTMFHQSTVIKDIEGDLNVVQDYVAGKEESKDSPDEVAVTFGKQ